MNWLHPPVRKGEVSWQGVRSGVVGEKCEKLIAGILLCVFNSTVDYQLFSHCLGDEKGGGISLDSVAAR